MVIAMGGEECTCGRKGCWEAYASAPALIRQTKAAAQKHPSSLMNQIVGGDLSKIDEFTAFEARKLGDATAREVTDKYLEYLAEGITNIIDILMPAAVILGGPITKLGECFLKPLRELVNEKVYAKDVIQPEFKIAEISGASVMIGAAMLGLYRNR